MESSKNRFIKGEKLKEPFTLNTSAAELSKEFQSQQIQGLRIPNSGLVDLWRPPPTLIYKLNFDGAIFSNNHSSGEVMAALSAKGPHVSDAKELEILSLRRLCFLQLSWIP
nr:hypothetical protein CFP56_37460 [Quercus suber]